MQEHSGAKQRQSVRGTKDAGVAQMKALGLAVIALVLAIPVRGQDDVGASLTISFVNGVSSFHVGEVIRVELSFRALVPGAYDIEKSVQERSVLFSLDQFHATPGGRDPLANNFSSVWGIAGDSLGSQWPLTSEPSTWTSRATIPFM